MSSSTTDLSPTHLNVSPQSTAPQELDLPHDSGPQQDIKHHKQPSQHNDEQRPRPLHSQGRAKSYTISNGSLHHNRSKGSTSVSPTAEGSATTGTTSSSESLVSGTKTPISFEPTSHMKKVSFSNFRPFATGVDLTSSSITSSEDEHFEDDEGYFFHHNPQHLPSTINTSRKNSLRKLSSHPMGFTQSLDSQVLATCDSNSSLPEFNKRPLTDTPIVSSVTSPVTRTQSSDDEDCDENDITDSESAKGTLKGKQSNSTNQNVDIDSESTQDDENTVVEDDEQPFKSQIAKTKNISHLNLLDLNSRSVSPNSVPTKAPPPTAVPSLTTTTPTPSPPPSSSKDDAKEVVALRPKIKDSIAAKQINSAKLSEELKSILLTKPPPPARKAYTLNIPGQTSSKISPDGRIASVDVGSKLVIVMVGLPARGKSYITNKLTRYLNWLQHDCRVFNVGNTRRKDKVNNAGPEANPLPDIHTPNNENLLNATSPDSHPKSPSGTSHNADFFNPENNSSTILREKWAMDTLDQLLNYVIDGPGSVGIFDATNSTKRRRLRVLKRIQERSNGELKVLFLESVCSDPSIIESNIRLKLSGPDYRDMDPEDALKDFVGRLHNYEKAYETIDDLEEAIPAFQYVKMIDVGKKVVSYNIQGFLASQTIYFLLNFNLCERQIWITRHGESADNLNGRIGGDSHLTKRGEKFSKALLKFMDFQRKEFRKQQLERFSTRLELKYNSVFNKIGGAEKIDSIPSEPNFCVWTSMLCRAIETGKYFDDHLYSLKEMRMLNELGGGKFEGMTYEEIQNKHPKEFQARIRNKLTYRYPGVGGESYLDVLTRLRPLITEIERTTDNLLIISHRVVLRILLAYFLNLDNSSIGELDVPLHTLYCLELKPYGTEYRMYEFDEGLDWFRKVEPDHQKNVKEVGVVFRERKYSVVPTAPPTSAQKDRTRNRTYSNTVGGQNNQFSLRRSLSFGANGSTPSTKPEPGAIRDEGLTSTTHPRLHGLTANTTTTGQTSQDSGRLSSKKLADLKKLRGP